MALFDLDGKELTNMPHQAEYDRWMRNLSHEEHRGVISAIHTVLDDARDNNKPVYSSYIPGSDWEGTAYWPIYIACQENRDASRLFYGQLCWEAVQEHEDDWVVINQKRDDDHPGGKIYFIRR